MSDLKHFEVWFVTGSQHLYGEETLRQVDEHARHIAEALDGADTIPVRVVFKSVVTTPEAILQVSRESNGSSMCIGVIAWMHTFSPAKMWISGLAALQKPLLHLHTQFNRELPWDTIDMDFMNLNQSAHGDREFGYITTRVRQSRKIVVGYWDDPAVRAQIAAWTRAAAGWHEAGTLKVVRFGDNMRQVAVTEGDKVEAELKFGFSVNGHGISELVQAVRAVPKAVVDGLVGEYEQHYELAPSLRSGGECRESLREAAQIEAGLRSFLEAAGFKAFTDTFEDLDGLPQLPGIAVQRLMAEGYGFGGEGDWKTAALVRILKVMSTGMTGGTSFMEDYTYHLAPNDEGVLGAHMLEVCPSITNEKPSAQVHPLSIGGKEPPVRLVFTAEPGPAVVVGMLDMGERFRLVTNQVEVVRPEERLPNLPVARALWKPQPDLVTATHAWLLAGGPHHTVFTQALGMEVLEDFAEIAQVELLVIDENTRIAEFKKELRWNRAYYSLARGL